jgi:hypothetical protein
LLARARASGDSGTLQHGNGGAGGRRRPRPARAADRPGSESAAALAAVLTVESGGRGFGNDGRTVIRFENHVFRKEWGETHADTFNKHFKFDAKEVWKGHQWRKATADPWMTCHTTQASEWDALEFAKTLDEEAALKSASHGVGQVMGFNHNTVGYTNAKDMAKAFDGGIKPQLDAVIAYIKENAKCMKGMKAKDYTLFAEGYNGGGQTVVYGARIKEAAEAYSEVTKGQKHAD